MTELSYVWNGLVTGDATLAPYDKDEFNKYMQGIHIEDQDKVYVIPGYLDDLEIRAGNESGGLFVNVAAGAALFGEYVYINSEEISLQLDLPYVGFVRWDFIVLRRDVSQQTIRIAVVKGDPVDILTDLEEPNINTEEFVLARILVNDLAGEFQFDTVLEDKYVYDFRVFATTNFTKNKFAYVQHNLIKNSEFMAYSSSDGSMPPDLWDSEDKGSLSLTLGSKIPRMARGQTITLVNESIYQYFDYNITKIDEDQVFTVLGTYLVSGTSGGFTISLETGQVSDPIILKQIEYVGDIRDPVEGTTLDTFQFTTKRSTDDLNERYRIKITGASSNVLIGQIIVVPGYHPGPIQQYDEYIPFYEAVPDANWTNTAKSSGTTLINLSTDFGGTIPNGAKAVILRIRGRDSGSAGGNASIAVQGYAAPYNVYYGQLMLDGVTNDVYREIQCVVPINHTFSNTRDSIGYFRVVVVATGAGTLDATLEIVGLII